MALTNLSHHLRVIFVNDKNSKLIDVKNYPGMFTSDGQEITLNDEKYITKHISIDLSHEKMHVYVIPV